MAELNCRHFNGYKPCGLSSNCDSTCLSRSIVSTRILLIHLGAMGAVLRSTALLKAIRKKFPSCHITWVTEKPSGKLLKGNPFVDHILELSENSLLELEGREFDVVFSIDKSRKAAGILSRISSELSFGFSMDSYTGAIKPINKAAEYLWSLGLNNDLKFFENKLPETRLVHDALELGEYCRDPYILNLTANEKVLSQDRRRLWSRGKPLVGINTGCADVIPYKKLSLVGHRQLISELLSNLDVQIVLLGGPAEKQWNADISRGLRVFQSPVDQGLRDGAISMDACDIVVTGDSLGMHMAIALEKWVVAWFGPTCAHEIDLFGHGVKVKTDASCSPCWKRFCDKELMCHDQVQFSKIVEGVSLGLKKLGLRGNDLAKEIRS